MRIKKFRKLSLTRLKEIRLKVDLNILNLVSINNIKTLLKQTLMFITFLQEP